LRTTKFQVTADLKPTAHLVVQMRQALSGDFSVWGNYPWVISSLWDTKTNMCCSLDKNGKKYQMGIWKFEGVLLLMTKIFVQLV